jgi:hypothetical protein
MHGIGVGMLSRSPSALSGIFRAFPFASSPNGLEVLYLCRIVGDKPLLDEDVLPDVEGSIPRIAKALPRLAEAGVGRFLHRI